MILKLLNAMGPRWAMQRVGFAIEHRTGALKRRMPQRRWQELALAEYLRPEIPGEAEAYLAWRKQNAAAFFFSHARLTKPFDAQSAIAAGERVLSGELPFFGHSEQTGFPPEWHRDPLTGTEWPRDRHWSEIDDFSLGDIKLVWEPSRFAFVFALVRAYATAGDERYAAAFWRAVEDWLDSNPPNSGVNWKCGQEATFRVMAWCFGLYAFEASPESRADRVAKMTLAIALHGERIAGHIDYALSQRNNHGLSEATGLFTIGTLFPELRRSAEWRALGRRLIGRQVPEQFYADGSYIQHSFNYQRVALHVLLWAMRLAEISGEPFSKDCYEAVGRSALVLARFCDSQSGIDRKSVV